MSALSLAPSAARVRDIDQGLRLRLTESLKYLAEMASLGESSQDLLASIEARLNVGPVSPWVFGLYAKLVAELSKSPQGDARKEFAQIAHAASLPSYACITNFCDPAIATDWWEHFQVLFDTDRQRPFRPESPVHEASELCKKELLKALATLERSDRAWHEEVRNLLRLIVLAAPRTLDSADLFNGASTFFLWGGALVNADIRRNAIAMLDLLVHESSHVLLFGISTEGGLTRNSGRERYDSPVRNDKRPIDGIFHACFVSTRVHLAMNRLLQSNTLGEEEMRVAAERQRYNGESASAALEVLERHAQLTATGEKVMDSLRVYWAGRGLD
jgi:hypothetical protein